MAWSARRHVFHPERSQRAGGWILASNHISHFDPALLTIATRRRVDWMAMADLFKNRALGAWMRGAGAFPVVRFQADRSALRTAIARLQAGRVVGMFPEGGLRHGETSVLGGAPLRRGIRAMAELGDAPVVPCVILGADRLYCAAHWRPWRRAPVWIGFGEPLNADGPKTPELELALAEALRTLCAEMRAHFQLSDDDLPKSPQERMRVP